VKHTNTHTQVPEDIRPGTAASDNPKLPMLAARDPVSCLHLLTFTEVKSAREPSLSRARARALALSFSRALSLARTPALSLSLSVCLSLSRARALSRSLSLSLALSLRAHAPAEDVYHPNSTPGPQSHNPARLAYPLLCRGYWIEYQ
jgi:hypothetical protein